MTEPKPEETTNVVDTAKAVNPNGTTSQESTPIADELEAASKAVVEDDEPDEDDDHEDFNAGTEFPPLEKAKSYKVDVKRALERETQDGKGADEVPESDFVSFATDAVEKED